MPASPYAVSKVFSHQMVINYRESYNMHCSNGILFNHESPIRGINFVTRKVTKAFARIKLKKQKDLTLGNIFAERDWGHAEDYVKAIWKILQQKKPADFVIATGEKYSVKDMVDYVASLIDINLKWSKNSKGYWNGIDQKTKKIIVKTSNKNFRPNDVNCLLGDSSKAKIQLKWKPKYNFRSMMKQMLQEDIKREAK